MIVERLKELSTTKVEAFNSKLIPGATNILGCRIPDIRNLAKELKGTSEATEFLNALPHRYYEENILHACLLGQIKDSLGLVKRIEEFLPYVDNWAVCDCMVSNLKQIKKDLEFFFPYVESWYKSKKTYYIRCSFVIMMSYFLEDAYIDKVMKYTCIEVDDYYVNMAAAWLFQALMVKYFDRGIEYLKSNKLSYFVHNKAISKCVDSYAFSKEQKESLKKLRRYK